MTVSVGLRLLVPLAALLLTAGCQSYDIEQRNVFVDDDGNRVYVDYGRSKKDHVNTFVVPKTGEEMEFKSKLVVEVVMPDGKAITAWQCMNFLPRGTMYETDDRVWKVLVSGFSVSVFHRTDEEPPRYLEVFRGVLCETPELGEKKESRWRKVKPRARETSARKGQVKK